MQQARWPQGANTTRGRTLRHTCACGGAARRRQASPSKQSGETCILRRYTETAHRNGLRRPFSSSSSSTFQVSAKTHWGKSRIPQQ
eukprot:1193791-Prorocentrum_minimum.AAC.1